MPLIWGFYVVEISLGRAPALQAGGQRFDPVILHQNPKISRVVYLWLLSNQLLRSLTKWKKVVYHSDELLIHVVIASVLVLQLGQDSTNELPVATLEREFKVIGSSD